jgi:hypothetical protein
VNVSSRVSAKHVLFYFAKLVVKRVSLFCETNLPFHEISLFVKRSVSHVS